MLRPIMPCMSRKKAGAQGTLFHPGALGGAGGGRRGRPAPLLLAVDGTALAWRAAQAVEQPGGQGGAQALMAFLGLLVKVAELARPTACVVGFDDRVASARRAIDPAYRADPPPQPVALEPLLDGAPKLLSELGLAVVVPPGLEADDVLGSAAALAGRWGVAATLATGDQDVFALVRPTVRVLLVRGGGRVEQVTPSWVRSRYGVPPERYAAFAALRGDAGDGLEGLKGLSAVSAARLLAAYPEPEAAFADLTGVSRLLGPGVAEALRTQRGRYERNRALMAIRTDVPIDLAACNRPLDPRGVAAALQAAGAEAIAGPLAGAFRFLGRASWRRAPAGAPARG